MMLRIDPPITLRVLSKDDYGVAHFVIDHGAEENLVWVCFMEKTGEIWCIDNADVRACPNATLGRNIQK